MAESEGLLETLTRYSTPENVKWITEPNNILVFNIIHVDVVNVNTCIYCNHPLFLPSPLSSSSHDSNQETQPLFDSELTSSEMSKGDQGSSHVSHLLWVDKYAPKLYTELLSDDVRRPFTNQRMWLHTLLD